MALVLFKVYWGNFYLNIIVIDISNFSSLTIEYNELFRLNTFSPCHGIG